MQILSRREGGAGMCLKAQLVGKFIDSPEEG